MLSAGTSDADGQFAERGVILPETRALFERQEERKKKILTSTFIVREISPSPSLSLCPTFFFWAIYDSRLIRIYVSSSFLCACLYVYSHPYECIWICVLFFKLTNLFRISAWEEMM